MTLIPIGVSVGAITSWTNGQGNCYDPIDLNNDPPVLELLVPDPPGKHQNLKVPRETPFVLSATGSDPDSDVVKWTWEQMNAPSAPTDPLDGSDNPLFRSYRPGQNTALEDRDTRIFPKYSKVLANDFGSLGEVLATVDDLPMTFQVTAQDGNGAWAAGVVDLVTLGAPFRVTEPSISDAVLAGPNTITWDHEGAAEAGATEVEVFLSEENGSQSSWESIGIVSNDGEAVVDIEPDAATQVARLKLEAVDQVFFTVTQPFTIAMIECPETYGCPANCIPSNCHSTNTGEPACFEDGQLVTCHWGPTVMRTICDCVQPPTQGGRGGGNQIPVPTCPSGHTNQSWHWSSACN